MQSFFTTAKYNPDLNPLCCYYTINLVTTTESGPAAKLMCDQEKGNSALQAVGMTLQIGEMKDCESSVSYVTKQHGMTKPEVCDSLIDNLLEKLPGDDSAKQFIRGQYDDFGVDKETTKVSDLCKCTCQKGNTITSIIYYESNFMINIMINIFSKLSYSLI